MRPLPALVRLVLLAVLAAGCTAPPVAGPDRDLLVAAVRAGPRDGTEALRRQQERVTGAPFVGGNAVELLRDGPRTLAAMYDAVRSARRGVAVESYQFDAEEGGRFADLLLATAARGVDVALIYDAWGSMDAPDALFDRLRRGGVRVLAFNPIGSGNPNRRDHRKLLVVDGAVAITGGVNLSSVYRNRPGDAPGSTDPDEMVWRDTAVRVRGPAVAQFLRLFERAWREGGGPPLPIAFAAAPGIPAPGAANAGSADRPRAEAGALVQAVDGEPGTGRPLIHRSLLSAIGLAQRSVHLTTGYFVPTPDLARALADAARRGVDVQVVVPGVSDSTAAVLAGRSHYAALLDAGVGIHERGDRVMHAKTAVVDGVWSAVGSSNLDWRSAVHNLELDAVVLDEDFGRRMEALFADDVAASRRIDPARWAARPLPRRLGEWGARLLGYML